MEKNDFETPLDAEGWGAHYNESMLERVVYLVKNDRLTSWSRKVIEMTQPGDRVLEIGCGSGETSLALALAGRRATAIDYSKSSVALARRASEVLGVSLDVRLVDATQKLPFPDESFDLAFQAGLLEHFQKEERIRLLDLWRPVCRTMVSMIPNAHSLAFRAGKYMMERAGVWPWGLEMPQDSLLDEFLLAGYGDVRESTLDAMHAVQAFLPEGHYLRTALERWFTEEPEAGILGQGYLLLTVGKNMAVRKKSLNQEQRPPKISVVLPVYNGERYLRESLDSILAQTMDDFELIAVDDCSTDRTPAILAEYAARDSRIRIIRNAENQKLPRTLNIGFAEARGEYLTWTSDDNAYLPEAFARMAERLDRTPEVAMVNASVDMMDETGKVEKLDGDPFDADPQMSFYSNCIGACFLYRRKVLEEIGGYDPEMFLIEDHEYWIRIMLRYGRIDHIKEVLYRYRHHAGSLTAQRRSEIIKQSFKARGKHLQEILPRIIENRMLTVLFFCHGFATNEWQEEQNEIFYRYLPELRRIGFLEGRKPLIVYAYEEQYARFAVQKHGGKAAFIAVKDLGGKGEQWAGIPLIAGEELRKKKDTHEILVASHVADLYAALEDLGHWGVEKCGIVLA